MRSLHVFPFLALIACSSPADDPAAAPASEIPAASATATGTPARSTSAPVVTPFAVKPGAWRQCVYESTNSSKLKTIWNWKVAVDGDSIRMTHEYGSVYVGTVDDARTIKATLERSDQYLSGTFSDDGTRLTGKYDSGAPPGVSYAAPPMVMYLFDGNGACPNHP